MVAPVRLTYKGAPMKLSIAILALAVLLQWIYSLSLAQSLTTPTPDSQTEPYSEKVAALETRVAALETGAADPLAGITIADEHRCSHYHADDYSYPQSIEPKIVAGLDGRIYSPYTGRYFDSIRETDIEHIVARSEAHDSGLCKAGLQARQRFSQDLENLTLASPTVNRHQKVDKDLAEWLPDLNQCWYVAQVVAVKRKYSLTMDRAEADTARRVLAGCTSTDLIFQERSTPAPESISIDEIDENGDGRITCAEARKHGIAPVHSDHPAYAYMRDGDGDGDGVVCED